MRRSRPARLLTALLTLAAAALTLPAPAYAETSPSARQSSLSQAPSLAWTAAVADYPRGGLNAISCPTTSMCLGVDANGNAVVGTAGVWSPALPVTPARLEGVSCASPTFCVAIGLNFVTTYNGHTWSLPVVIDRTPVPHLFSVTCATATFCMAANAAGYVFTYNGAGWSAPVLADADRIDSISCATPTMCMAVDILGGIARWDGHVWHAPTAVLDAELTGLDVESVDCASATFCVATSPFSSSMWNGSTWSARTTVVAFPDLLDQLSCPTTTWCAALDLAGTVWTSTNGRTWTKGPSTGFQPTTPGSVPLRSLSCAAANSCVAIGSIEYARPAQDVRTFNGTSWSAIAVADEDDDGWLSDVSCATTTTCVAVDRAGFAVVRTGSTWSYPQKVLPDLENVNEVIFNGLDCPSATMCMAVDSAGNAWTFNGSSWSGPVRVASVPVGDLSCPTTTFCMVLDARKNIRTYDGKSWKKQATAPPEPIGALTCASPTYCLAFTGSVLDVFGVRTWIGKTWSAVVRLGGGSFATVAADCSAVGDCTAVSLHAAVHLKGTTWSAPSPLDSTARQDISCAGPGTCQLLEQYGVAPLTNGVEGTPVTLTPAADPSALSCATATSCSVVSRLYLAYTSH
jgi:hypothetical protein